MFEFLKRKGDKLLKASSPEGEKIKKPISPSVQGRLRHALELLAYILENKENEEQHIISFVATVDSEKSKNGDSGIESMDAVFVRASDESVCEMFMQVAMKDDVVAKAIIAVSHAVQFHKPDMKEFADELEEGAIERGYDKNNKNKKKSKHDIPPEILKEAKEKGLDIEAIADNMRAINIEDLKGKTPEDFDKLIDDLTAGTGMDDDDDDY
jgi:hypothetical protein